MLQLSAMTKSPYPLFDPIMVGPALLCLNSHFSLLPDLLLLRLVAVSCYISHDLCLALSPPSLCRCMPCWILARPV